MKKNILALALLALISISIPALAHTKTGIKTIKTDTLSQRRVITHSTVDNDDVFKPGYLVIISNDKAFKMDTLNAAKYLDPKWMASVEFPEGPEAADKYGIEALAGVPVVTIDDAKFPNAFMVLKEYMAFIGKHEATQFYDFTSLPEGL